GIEYQPAAIARYVHRLDGFIAGGNAGRAPDGYRTADRHRDGPDAGVRMQPGICHPVAFPCQAQSLRIGPGGEALNGSLGSADPADPLSIDVTAAIAVRNPEDGPAVGRPLRADIQRAVRSNAGW